MSVDNLFTFSGCVAVILIIDKHTMVTGYRNVSSVRKSKLENLTVLFVYVLNNYEFRMNLPIIMLT